MAAGGARTGVQLNIPYDYHLIVIRFKQRVVDHLRQVLLVAVTQILHGFRRALGGVQQTFALRIFTDSLENFAVMPGQFFVHGAALFF